MRVQKLQKQTETTERCLAILTRCQTRDEVIDGLDQITSLLMQTGDPVAGAAQTAYLQCRTFPDKDVFQVRDDFIRQFNAFLSTTATIGDSQETEVAGTPQSTPMASGTPQQTLKDDDIVAKAEALGKTGATTKGKPVSGGMLYLWVIRQNKQPTKKLYNDVLDHYGGEGVVMLGGHKTDDPLPRKPEAYVVITCLRVCKENNIAFDSTRDNITYSVDIVNGEEIGVCQIRVQAD